jgi:hypothetical protein
MTDTRLFLILGLMALFTSVAFAQGYGYDSDDDDDGGNQHDPIYVDVQVLCDGTTITVTNAAGAPVKSMIMVATATAIYYQAETGDDGVAILPYGQVPCGTMNVEVLVNPDNSGYVMETIYMNFNCPDDCQPAQEPGCTTDQELVNGQCVSRCPTGQVRVDGVCVQCASDSDCSNGMTCQNHVCVAGGDQCTPPACCKEDSECGQGSFCEIGAVAAVGKCAPIICGTVVNHQLVPYECGVGCPSCIAPEVCEENVCHLYGIECPSTAKVGEQVTCTVTKDGEPCQACSGTITDPSGAEVPFTTDANGEFTYTPPKSGSYTVALPGTPAETLLTVTAQPPASTGQPQGGSQQDGISLPLLLLLFLLLLILGGAAYMLLNGMGHKKK